MDNQKITCLAFIRHYNKSTPPNLQKALSVSDAVVALGLEVLDGCNFYDDVSEVMYTILDPENIRTSY